jgi:hypothetical protein
MGRSHLHLAVSVHRPGRRPVGDRELGHAAQIERGRAALAENLEAERVRHPEGNSRNGERAGGAVGERCGERGDVFVLDRLPDVTDRHPGRMPDRSAQRDRPVRDHGLQDRAPHTLHRAAQEFAEVALALERLESGRTVPREVVLTPHLVVRGTTAPPAIQKRC